MRTLTTLFVCALTPVGIAAADEQGTPPDDAPAPVEPAEPEVTPPPPPAPKLTGGLGKWFDPGAVVEEEDPELAGAVDDSGGGGEGGDGQPPVDTGGGGGGGGDGGRPVKPGFTGIKGTVLDAQTGEGLIEATVNVVKGGSQSVTTEVDGSFELELAPGEYELRVYTGLYKGTRLRVVVQRGKAQELTVKLEPETDIEEVLVEAKVQRRNEAALLQVRKKAVAVSDVISAQEISRTPDASAGDAVKRVVSVTILDGKYVVLRGLEGRYVQTLLNGVVLPSPEPDRNAVPLDLFPTSLLANLTVVKSYSAEMPGQFGGGVLLIETNTYPEQFELKVTGSTSANSSDTFEQGLYNAGGSPLPNALGFDDGSRDLPYPVPINAPVRDLDLAYTEQIGESFSNVWSGETESVNPNFSAGVTVGDTRKLPGTKKLGYLATFSARKNFDVRLNTVRTTETRDDALDVDSEYTNTLGEHETTLGGLINAGLELNPRHTVSLFGLYTHVGESATGYAAGTFNNGEFFSERYRIQFVERQLGFAQLLGDHRLSNRVKLRWQGNAAITGRDELDSRDVVYDQYPGEAMRSLRLQPGSAQRFFSFLDDQSLGGGADVTAEVSSRFTLRGGLFAQDVSRTLESRRFRFRAPGSRPAEILALPPEQMLSAEHIGPVFVLTEETLQEDSYQAGLRVLGAHGSVEAEVSESLRAIAGLRYEHSNQHLQNGTPFALSGNLFDVEYPSGDLFPSANVIHAVSPAMNVRGAYSYTLVRPRFRELSPFLFFDYVRGRSISGNPDLRDTKIHHGDLRWEWFPGESEVLAASAFYKKFRDPIEQVAINTANDARYVNAQGADMYGLELEARFGLGRLAQPLRDLKVGANLALIRSEIELDPTDEFQTNDTRPLYGQSPYAINLSAGYDHPRRGEVTVLYNVTGARISDVGVEMRPDIYEQPLHRLDVVAARRLRADLKLKASVSNLLNQSLELTQGDIVVAGYSPGVQLSIGLDWSP